MKTSTKVFIRSFFLQLSFDPKHMQALGYLYAIWPHLKKNYAQDELKDQALSHLVFFNTHPWLISPILGANIHESLKTTDEKSSLSLKTSTMGPFGGIGDQMAWFLVLPFFSLISLLSLAHPSIALLGLIISLSVFRLTLTWVLFQKARQQGISYLLNLASSFKELYQVLKPLGIITLAGFVYWLLTQTAHFTNLEGVIYALIFYGLLKKTRLSHAVIVVLIVLSQFILYAL